jgi:hypothetical protein
MANETMPPYQPEQSQKEYQAERAHKDYQASIETGRAAAQAAILINGGAATAMLAFLSKQMPPPPNVVKWASVSLLFYAVGVACGAFSMFSSAHSSGSFANAWQAEFFASGQQDAERTEAVWWLTVHRWVTWSSFASFVLASGLIAWAFFNCGIIK